MAISADLGEVLEKVVNDLVENGRYNSKSEVLREGVRLVQEREARLRELEASLEAAQVEAERDGWLDAEAVFDELKARYATGRKTA
ncbi:type II toxin-antitoxin system ParD family antitoxin [Devosia salina]|uniref:Type II toxin-antitoxin system ParD family antitoxin n=1 Tax=Devosia salina TaxID=2860336 RepID=A0ABX8WIE3_9HYPH|nr:type II toxin-antitoxin system ParD family antitoxin [Devosia salina]QYO76447.1 type II toxin-antitoxin system ParD family antitoxin [Devosia salina]